ncbi:Tm-1-like ATP-binding domain-containing protein [Humibacter soli]
MAPTVVLVGALDTKADEYAFVRDRLNAAGVDTVVVDTGVLGSAGFEPDISREQVAAAGGGDLAALVAAGDRGAAMAIMATGATSIVAELQGSGRIDGALALGGTGGTSLAATAFRGLPVGFPKLIVSTAASGNTEMYVAETDLILMPSIVDIAGLNRISLRILRNAAAAMAGMVGAPPVDESAGKPMVAASMFGVTTPCVTRARERLESLGYEVLVFHMTGAGGRAMESLCDQGFFAGVLDVTTTELADHLVGGVFDAGPNRLTAAGRTGTPQVISVGALDMVNFGPMDTVPERFRHRNLYEHNSSVTLMRTTPDECAELGAEVAAKAKAATGPTTVFLPLGGISAIAVDGGPFYDAEADRRLFDAIRSGLADSPVSLVEVDTDVNDPAFADTVVDALHAAITTR